MNSMMIAGFVCSCYTKGRIRVHEKSNIIDGLHEIYMNAEVKDGSDVSDLMDCFKQEMLRDPKFPVLSSKVQELKNTEGGLNAVCKVMEYYEEIAAAKARIEAKAEADRENHLRVFKEALEMGIPREQAIRLSRITEEELQMVVL